MTAHSTTPTTRNTGIIAIDPAINDAVGAAILVLVDERGVMRVQWQTGDLEQLPGDEIRAYIDASIHAAMSIANSPGFER